MIACDFSLEVWTPQVEFLVCAIKPYEPEPNLVCAIKPYGPQVYIIESNLS